MKYVTYHHPVYGDMQVPVDPPIGKGKGAKVGNRVGAWVAGSNSQIQYQVVLPSSDWRPFIFSPEPQYFDVGDTFACTNFANNNTAKVQLYQSSGYQYNFSEAADAVLSGTEPGVGNYMDNPPEHTRKAGRILQSDWPNGSSVSEFYRPVSKAVQNKSVHFKEAYEFIDPSFASIQYHLKQAPVTIMITNGAENHDVVAVFVDSNGIWYFDSYPHDTQNNFLAITTQVPQAALKIIVKHMNTIYFVHRTGTTEYGLLVVSPVGRTYTPASTEPDLKIRGGNSVPLKPDGSVDYSQAQEINIL